MGSPITSIFLVVVYHLHSKWAELVPTGTVTSQVNIDFVGLLFSPWGPQLFSTEFTTYLAHRGIRHVRTAYYPSQANAGMEHFHQSLKTA